VLTTRIAWLISNGRSRRRRDGRDLHQQGGQGDADAPVRHAAAAVRGMWIGTFHGLCNRFLRAHWKLAGLPQAFQILDTADQLSAVKRVIKAMNLDEERFVPKQVAGSSPR
jgi:DNA helicase-2/ATP-dependent DNA helicase PcrA